MSVFHEGLKARGFLLLDGGFGSLLMAAGLKPGVSPEAWNLDHPERIREVHRGYLEAGSQVILTNSFGANPFRLAGHGLKEKVFELNAAAARIARAAADGPLEGPQGKPPSPLLVAGSMGPTGEMMEPLGTLTPGAARSGFAAQAAGLSAGGVDLLWVETMSDLQEMQAALEGARDACTLPVVATMTFESGGRTMMGVTPEEAVAFLVPYDLQAIGANCGSGVEETEEVIRRMVAADPGIPLVAKSNAGKPAWVRGELVYDGTPAVMTRHAMRIREIGAQLIGGCCGTTPEHIRAMGVGLEG